MTFWPLQSAIKGVVYLDLAFCLLDTVFPFAGGSVTSDGAVGVLGVAGVKESLLTEAQEALGEGSGVFVTGAGFAVAVPLGPPVGGRGCSMRLNVLKHVRSSTLIT